MNEDDRVELDDDEPKTWRDLAEAAIMDLRSYADDDLPHRRLVSAAAYEKRFALLKSLQGADTVTEAMLDAGETAYDAVPEGSGAHRRALGKAFTAMRTAAPTAQDDNGVRIEGVRGEQ